MRTIWKFPISVLALQDVQMPVGAEVLSIDVQHDVVCLWALVEPSPITAMRAVFMCGTGHPVPNVMVDIGAKFIGTILLNGEKLVLHVFVQDCPSRAGRG